MRLTYTDLYNAFLQNTGNLNNSSDTNLVSFFKRHLSSRYQLVLSKLSNYATQQTQTASTVADQQYYHQPPGLVDVEAVNITIGSRDHNLKPVNSQSEWNRLNAIDIQAGSLPQYFFVRRDDFGIWPIPQDAYTITLDYHFRDRNLTTADYTTGTVTPPAACTPIPRPQLITTLRLHLGTLIQIICTKQSAIYIHCEQNTTRR